jgi:hypothetical protein
MLLHVKVGKPGGAQRNGGVTAEKAQELERIVRVGVRSNSVLELLNITPVAYYQPEFGCCSTV